MHCDYRLASIQMSASVSVAGIQPCTLCNFNSCKWKSERVNKNVRIFCAIW